MWVNISANTIFCERKSATLINLFSTGNYVWVNIFMGTRGNGLREDRQTMICYRLHLHSIMAARYLLLSGIEERRWFSGDSVNETDRQTDMRRRVDGQRDRRVGGQRDRRVDGQRDRRVGGQRDRRVDGQRDKRVGGQRDRRVGG